MARILVVDGYDDTRYLTCRVLTRLGHECTGVPTGHKALPFLDAVPPPHLIVLDMLVGVPSGLDLLRTVRQNPATADIPVVVFTSYDEEVFREEAKRLRVLAYLIRNADGLDRLKAEVRRVLGRSARCGRARDAGSRSPRRPPACPPPPAGRRGGPTNGGLLANRRSLAAWTTNG